MLRHLYDILSSIVTDREIYQHWITQESVFPCVTITVVRTDFEHTICDTTQLPEVQIDTWSKDFGDAYDTGEIVKTYLMKFSDDTLICRIDNEKPIAEKPPDGSDNPIFRRAMRFKIKLK